MSGPPSVVRHAPGKLFIVGEYAVVEPGHPAILTAVDRRVSVQVAGLASGGVAIDSDLCPRQVRLHRADGRLTGDDEQDEQLARSRLAHVVSAIEVLDELLAERGEPAPGLRVSISSGLHDNGTKYGLGSSGAVTVATLAAVAAARGVELGDEERYRLAMLASARLDPGPSGGDLAASTWGGWIEYQAPDRAAVIELALRKGLDEALRAPWPGFRLRRLPPPPGLTLEIGWTGEPASTGSLVAALGARRDGGHAWHQRFLTRSAECVRAATRAFTEGEPHRLLEQIRRARRLLAGLDEQTGLGIFTPRLTALCDAAEALGGAAKPSGAGGGDCGIALLDAATPADVARLRERWAAAGVSPVPVRPATERNVGK